MTPVSPDTLLLTVVDRLRVQLGANLSSVIAYGSVVRGNWIPAVSDINLFLVLEESTPDAHGAIASIMADHRRLCPIIAGRRGLLRTFRSFAPKFLSMKRNYRLLHGEDCLRQLEIDPAQERFLVEQALRNQQMRCTYAFVTFAMDPKRYTRFVVRQRTAALVHISEMLRLGGVEIPAEHAKRLPIIEREINCSTAVLDDLHAIKKEARKLRSDEIESIHARFFALLESALIWIEQQWMAS